MVAGFQIKAQFEGAVNADEPWFNDLEGSYTNYTDGVTTNTIFNDVAHGLEVGDLISIFSLTGTSISLDQVEVTAKTDDTFTIDELVGAPEAGNTGNWNRYNSITWADSTPAPPFDGSEGFLREIHIQFSTSSSVVVEVTLDNGLNWLPLNNNAGIFGLATFTMFVKFDTLLNYRSSGATTVDIIVTGD